MSRVGLVTVTGRSSQLGVPDVARQRLPEERNNAKEIRAVPPNAKAPPHLRPPASVVATPHNVARLKDRSPRAAGGRESSGTCAILIPRGPAAEPQIATTMADRRGAGI